MTASESPAGRPPWLLGLLALLVIIAVSAVAAELGARAFWSLRHGVPFTRADRILYAYYPELRRVERKRPERGDEHFDVLFLGGSTLHGDWSQVEQALAEQLAYQGHRNVRVFNLAVPAQTTRDSWLKYAALRGPRFDLVLVYDGINDARTNNAPPEVFREDYSHYAWYETVNALAAYHGRARLALPYTLHYLGLAIRQSVLRDRYVPAKSLREDWLRYGGDIRSAAPFRRNLTALLELAARRGDPVLLTTFAIHAPEGYTPEGFAEKRLEYGLHLSPIEEWGRRSDVLAAVAEHNRVLRELADRHGGVLFVDQAELMAGSPLYFNDICHFTVLGSTRFAENLIPAILPRLAAR